MINLNLQEGALTRLFEELEEEIRFVEEGRGSFNEKLGHQERLYLAQPKQRIKTFPWEKASNIVVPLVPTFVDAVFARHMNTIHGAPNLWSVEVFSSEWVDVVDPWRDFFEIESNRTFDFYRKSADWLLSACKHGLGVIRLGWERTRRKIILPSEVGAREAQYDFHHGPKILFVPLRQCLWPSDATEVASARWFGRGPYWVSKRTFELGSRQGFYSNADSVGKHYTQREKGRDEEERDKAVGDQPPRTPEGVNLYEISWLLDLDGDGIEEEVILVLHRESKKFVRATWHPYWHGRRYFIGIRYWPLENSVMGLGMCNMLEQLAEAMSTVHNQATDNVTAANTRIWATRPGTPFARQNTKIYPNKVVVLDDPTNDLVPKQLGDVYPSVVEREAILRDYAERRVGVTDYSLGRESPVVGWRATATSTMSLLQEASRRFDLTLREIRYGMNEFALQATELYQQFKPRNRIMEALGDRAEGALRFVNLPFGRIRESLDIHITASTAAKNIEAERQSFLQLYQILSSYYQTMIMAAQAISSEQMPPLGRAATIVAMEKGSELVKRMLEAWPLPDPTNFLLNQNAVMEVLNDIESIGVQQASQGRAGISGY